MSTLTQRTVSDEMEKVLNQTINILDHGFVRVVDYMGDDKAVVQAARVSYGGGTKTVNEDKGLIDYLMKYHHTSPFEMCEIKLHIKLPIFVARQWVRHRTANINECSARYSILPKEFYIPNVENIAKQSSDNKQGRGDKLSKDIAEGVRDNLLKCAENNYNIYEALIGDEFSLARELARINLTLGHYTEWYWKIDLHNLLHFLRLRLHEHAQFEIRVYAEKIAEIVKKWCPLSFAAFEKYILNARTLTQEQISVLKQLSAGQSVSQENSGLSRRDYDEVCKL